ncbi:MAG TPA: YbhB/YbcL family Raf kinase inhibitor-like protein [Candidatus Baltobacteraceae bacterium]|nr:YbhB/YbcL family Raf kinase inhibitor-like protein [Candidatus Baltobacteraceae bacterium]
MFGRFVLVLSLCFVAPLAAQAAPFVVTSPDFADDGLAPLSGAQPTCGGGTSTSPALAWSGAPPSTKSYVILTVDVDNWGSIGTAAHWIAYGIPASVAAVPAGFGTQTAQYRSGLNAGNQPGFRGYCPTKGDAPHHYVFTVFATDLAPDALARDLTRDALIGALTGHTLAGSSVIARYAQPS